MLDGGCSWYEYEQRPALFNLEGFVNNQIN